MSFRVTHDFCRENSMERSSEQRSITPDYDDEEESYDEEEEDEQVSRDYFERTTDSFSSTHESINSSKHRQTRFQRLDANESYSPTKHLPSSPSTRTVHSTVKTSKKPKKEIFLILGVIFVVVFICVNSFNVSESDVEKLKLRKKEREEMLSKILFESIEEVQRNFPNQKTHIWNDISSRLYDVILYPERPSIIILFANETATMNCLAQILGDISAVMLDTNDYLMLTPDDFGNDLGNVIYSLKRRILQKKAIVVQDLLQVNTEAIKAFHNFCDRENPLVNKAIYIITILANGYEPWQNELAFVERKLYDRLLEEIDADILDPLITRITDGAIIPVQSEPTKNKCTLSHRSKVKYFQ